MMQAIIRPGAGEKVDQVINTLVDFSSQRIPTAMGFAGFNYNDLYSLADRRGIDLDSWKWVINMFEEKMLENERQEDGN